MQVRGESLTKQYGATCALDHVSLTIDPGRIVAVLGANGAGKTTLLNALSGLSPATSGDVYFDGERFTMNREDLRRRYAVIPDLPAVSGYWTPLRFIGTLARMYPVKEEGLADRAEKILADLDLLSVARWRLLQLSRGQQYKSILAGFILADPELWFVDEPFASGMDPRGLNCFKDYVRNAAQRGHTVIYTTQIIEVAEQFADRVVLLDHGKVVGDAPPSELKASGALSQFLSQLREGPQP
jgi:ABC-type multidrug transport system ATPase subunit